MGHQEGLTRRRLIQGLVAPLPAAALTTSARAQTTTAKVTPDVPYNADVLPAGIRSLPEAELRVYSHEYSRTGFQRNLQSYRMESSGRFSSELQTFSGRTIDQPSMFIGGKSDWGVYQNPGALERMQKTACTQMLGVHLVDDAGHWVQQEQPERVSRLLMQFLQDPRNSNKR